MSEAIMYPSTPIKASRQLVSEATAVIQERQQKKHVIKPQEKCSIVILNHKVLGFFLM